MFAIAVEIGFCILLCGGSALLASFASLRGNDTLPLGLFFSGALIYIFGLLGRLPFGVGAAALASLLCWILAFVHALRQHLLTPWLADLFSPGMVLFLLFSLIFAFADFGRRCIGYDEFSHWADVVKAMWSTGCLSTFPVCHSLFQSYPPAMAVFQYYFIMVAGFFRGTFVFEEWGLFTAYHLYLIVLFLPFLGRLKMKKPLSVILAGAVMFAAPALIYRQGYASIYIDFFLGMLGGFCFAYPLVCRRRTALFFATYSAALFTLVLTKDSGLLFALLSLLSFFLDTWLFTDKPEVRCSASKMRPSFAKVFIPAGAVLAAKLSWRASIAMHHTAVSFSSAYNFPELLAVLTNRSSVSWHHAVLVNFIWRFFVSGSIPVGNTAFQIPCWLITAILCAFPFLLRKCMAEPPRKKRLTLYSILLVVTSGVYIAGLCVTYIFKFPEDQAVRLDAFYRYLDQLWYVLLFFCLAIGFAYLSIPNRKSAPTAVAAVVFLLVFTPYTILFSYLSRAEIADSVSWRQRYDAVSAQLHSIAEAENASPSVAFFTQPEPDNVGNYDYLAARFSLRPLLPDDISENFDSSMRAGSNVDYDYVIVWELYGELSPDFSAAFVQPEIIQAYTLYRVDHETGLLSPCR